MKSKINKNLFKNKKYIYCYLIIFLLLLFLNIGFSAFQNKLSIEKKTDDDKDDDNDSDGIASVRDKIVKRANDIVNLRKQGKAWYSQAYRTVNYNKKNTIRAHYETVMGTTYKQPGYGKWGFDCSSLVGCAYDYAGYSFMRGLSEN